MAALRHFLPAEVGVVLAAQRGSAPVQAAPLRAMDPTQEEQRQLMRVALSSIGISAAAISSFDDSTLDKLVVAKFHLPERLPSASREDLKEAGLALGDVSLIMSKVQGAVAAAGPGQGSTAAGGALPAAAGESDVLATIKARVPCSAKYAAHLVVPALPPYKEAATVVGPHHVATFAHKPHEKWTIGLKQQVSVHCPQEDRRTSVAAEVVYHNIDKDVAILKQVERELASPVLDSAVTAGDKYYVHGQSTQVQADDTSISHGMVAATELDAKSHIRGDIVAGAGDSGGGCFSVATGKLIAMVVRTDPVGLKAVLLPIAVISSILADLSA
ncbi:hypothetical protein HYH02_009988 [Chlamydomonas schloesseri]|uniref:Uncharacterized protein n=1 Tax=Chlamydomonas schloesseri TaxID=2026947 RepID=A0A835T9P1_9CHLO|nr:hypothetical protein HYH02_009988 [Chlamydomonas schloesseri]|eukprot:KAG2441399.1 hypothetical protein HYH02_009988 [Chlamydomonas schloesseri]